MNFKPAARYPADPRAVFILGLSVFSGMTAILLKAAPESLEALLPRWAVLLWGALLCLGSLMALAGMAWQSVNGIVIEQVGNVMVGVTTIYYSVVALMFVGVEAVQTVGIIMAWGVACLLRWAQLQALLNNSMTTAKHRQLERQVIREVKEEVDRLEEER